MVLKLDYTQKPNPNHGYTLTLYGRPWRMSGDGMAQVVVVVTTVGLGALSGWWKVHEHHDEADDGGKRLSVLQCLWPGKRRGESQRVSGSHVQDKTSRGKKEQEDAKGPTVLRPSSNNNQLSTVTIRKFKAQRGQANGLLSLG